MPFDATEFRANTPGLPPECAARVWDLIGLLRKIEENNGRYRGFTWDFSQVLNMHCGSTGCALGAYALFIEPKYIKAEGLDIMELEPIFGLPEEVAEHIFWHSEGGRNEDKEVKQVADQLETYMTTGECVGFFRAN